MSATVTCTVCGDQVSKRQSLFVGKGRACRKHAEAQAIVDSRLQALAVAAEAKKAVEAAREAKAREIAQARLADAQQVCQLAVTIFKLATAKKLSKADAYDQFVSGIPSHLRHEVRRVLMTTSVEDMKNLERVA